MAIQNSGSEEEPELNIPSHQDAGVAILIKCSVLRHTSKKYSGAPENNPKHNARFYRLLEYNLFSQILILQI